MPIDDLLTPEEVAERLRVTVRTLNDMRRNNQGPRHVRIAHKTVRYRESDVASWLASR